MDTDDAVRAVRTALIGASRNRLSGEPLPVEVLRTRVAQIRQTRRLCGFAAVGQQLPELIRDIHITITAGREVKALVELAVTVHVDVTLMWLRDAGASVDLR